jgi:hypothetical protein
MLLGNRRLLVGLVVLLFLGELVLGGELMRARFDWRPLWQAPVVKATLVDFCFTVAWCALYVFDTARAQRRNGWAWLPLLLILPSAAMLLFTLTAPRFTPEGNRGTTAGS